MSIALGDGGDDWTTEANDLAAKWTCTRDVISISFAWRWLRFWWQPLPSCGWEKHPMAGGKRGCWVRQQKRRDKRWLAGCQQGCNRVDLLQTVGFYSHKISFRPGIKVKILIFSGILQTIRINLSHFLSSLTILENVLLFHFSPTHSKLFLLSPTHPFFFSFIIFQNYKWFRD